MANERTTGEPLAASIGDRLAEKDHLAEEAEQQRAAEAQRRETLERHKAAEREAADRHANAPVPRRGRFPRPPPSVLRALAASALAVAVLLVWRRARG
jgi:hypothetical protein